MANVNIIEGDYEYIPHDQYEEVKKDYMEQKLKIVDIMEKYGFSRSKMEKIQKMITEETGFHRKQNPKYYFYNNNIQKYIVYKKLNGVQVIFCRVDTEEEAKNTVEWLKKNNWDKKLLKETLKKYKEMEKG